MTAAFDMVVNGTSSALKVERLVLKLRRWEPIKIVNKMQRYWCLPKVCLL